MYAAIRGAELETRAQLHDALQSQLDLPDYYGRNLDALYDCLTDLHEPSQIEVFDEALLKEHLGFYAHSLLILLRRAADENLFLTVTVEE